MAVAASRLAATNWLPVNSPAPPDVRIPVSVNTAGTTWSSAAARVVVGAAGLRVVRRGVAVVAALVVARIVARRVVVAAVVGLPVGVLVGLLLGLFVGVLVGVRVGPVVGATVGPDVGTNVVGACLGALVVVDACVVVLIGLHVVVAFP